MRGGFLVFLNEKSLLLLFHLFRSGFSLLIKWFILSDMSFHFDFILFSYVFIIGLLRYVIVCWFLCRRFRR